MEGAITTIVSTFLSSTRGKDNLDQKGFQKLVQNKLGNIMENANCASAVKEMQNGLDDNKDGKVSFQEYFNLLGYLANSLSESQTGSNQESS